MGLVDLPPEQRQEPFLLDLPREGHMLIAGASGTGKSAFLRTIITSLALTHSPAQLHLYLIDFGGQALRVFEKLPHVGGTFGEDEDEQNQQLDELITAVANEAETYHVKHAPAIQLLPEYVRLGELLAETTQLAESNAGSSAALRLLLGIEDLSLLPIALELTAETPHVLVAGGPGSGRTSVLHICLFALANHQSSRYPSHESARIVLVDFRRSSRLLRSLPGIWMYADTEERLLEVVEMLKSELEARTAILREELQSEEEEELIEGKMAPIVLVIDDYDMLNILAKNPLTDLKELLLRARDLRFYIIVAGSPADLSRPDALLQQVRSSRIGMILGGDPNDLPVLGVRISDFPPGRGQLVRRNRRYLVQVAHAEAKEIIAHVTTEALV